MKKVGWLAVVIVVIVGGWWIIRPTEDADEYMRRESATLRQRTLPPSAVLVKQSGIKRTDASAEVSWEFTTEQNWTTYRDWLTQRLTPEFRSPAAGGDRAEFALQLPDDAHAVAVERLEDGPPLRVRILFRSYAD